jgi:DNA (cytosine-5)-methyltransferase 3A
MGCLVATDYKQPKQIINKPIRLGHLNKGGQGDRIYSTDGKGVCLSANGGGRGAKTGLYKDNLQVRKLTPVECERLQTVPDNYTDGVSDTQRYKMLGNGWTIDVITHILKKIET